LNFSVFRKAKRDNQFVKGVEMITIDGRTYDPETLSNDVKAQLNALVATDQEIARLKMLLAISQTARNAYAKALQDFLPK
jgi:hypothetical protein